jgi:hypothetical protein
MRTFQVILAMIALVVVAAQTFRHVYVGWVEPRGSVLDQFREKADQDIAASKTIGELILLYDPAWKKVQEEDAKHADDTAESAYARRQNEPYKSEEKLRQAITQREDENKELREVHFFWLCGLTCVLIGFFAYGKLSRWLGLSVLVLGYSEMIWATCPSFRAFGSALEFDCLLATKTICSIVTLILVLIVWRWIIRLPAQTESKSA